MANPEHLAQLDKCSRDDWNQWRASQSVPPDLSGANLHRKDLPERNLREADLKHADLSDTILGAANLKDADLRGANLRRATFDNTNLSGASLREANLQGVDLSVAQRGLQTEQLAGADLTGARLPDELTKLYEKLENVNNISESARKLFLAVLAACLYSWLTIATTTDVNLITNRASSPLPIIQTSIPIVGFYWVAPLLLLCVYFYFHFYLQKLWEELGSLPAIFPDGRPLHAKIDPWLLNDLVRSHLPKLNVNRPFLSYLQLWISVLLAWWVVPITMFLFWGRYLPRQDRTGTTFHVALLAISLTAALCLYRLAVATLRGAERKPFRWKGMLTSRRGYQTTAFATAVGVLFAVVSWGARWGAPSQAPILGIPLLYRSRLGTGREPRTLAPRLMALFGYSPFADIRSAEISLKKPAWSPKDRDQDLITGAQLPNLKLRYALANEVFLASANLRGVDLTGADLYESDLEEADLTGANLSGAIAGRAKLNGAKLYDANLSRAKLLGAYLSNSDLGFADLSGANLNRSDLSGADLTNADLQGTSLTRSDLTYTDFRKAKNLNVESVKQAIHWEKAFYDDPTVLGLARDNNSKLAEEQKNGKQTEAEAAPQPGARPAGNGGPK